MEAAGRKLASVESKTLTATAAWGSLRRKDNTAPTLPLTSIHNTDAGMQMQPPNKPKRAPNKRGRGDKKKTQQEEEEAPTAAPADPVDLLTDSDADEGTDEPKVMPAKAAPKVPAAETTRTTRSGRATTVPQSLESSLEVRCCALAPRLCKPRPKRSRVVGYLRARLHLAGYRPCVEARLIERCAGQGLSILPSAHTLARVRRASSTCTPRARRSAASR
jgi:hypothetical protein